MIKAYVILVVYTFLSYGSSSVYLVNDYEAPSTETSFFFVENENSHNLSGRLENDLLGLSLQSKTKEFVFKDAFMDMLAKVNGMLKVPQNMLELYDFPTYLVEVKSELLSRTAEALIIQTQTHMLGSMLGTQSYKLIKTPLQIDFFTGNEVESNRVAYPKVGKEKQALSSSVFQIQTEFGLGSLGGSSSTHGTGFFISDEGHALTNHHVLKENRGCIEQKVCLLNLKFTGIVDVSMDVSTQILTCSIENDFCLLKLDMAQNFNYTFLTLNFHHIPQKLFSLGYPGDKVIETDEGNITPLTYSFGSPIGFAGKAITSSVFVAAGASGSPVLSEGANQVVGLISNGAETFAENFDGAPGVFRPLFILEREFKISKYLSRDKNEEVRQVLSQLGSASHIDLANKIIANYLKMKTYIGYQGIVRYAYSHHLPEVRKLLVELLIARYDQDW